MVNNSDVLYLLNEARKNGISVFREDQKLKFRLAKNGTVNPDIIHSLKSKKQEILAFLKDDIGSFKSISKKETPIIALDRNSINRLPLSFSQERLWFINKLSGSTNYHVPLIKKFDSDLNSTILNDALNALVKRHEVLRTVYPEFEGTPYQKILDSDQWQLNFKKIGKRGEQEAINDWIANEIKRPFDLTTDYLFRASLIELLNGTYVLVIVIHHIATDGWSTDIINREVLEWYQSKLIGRPANLKPLDIQYADYAYWQRKELSGDNLEEKLTYWEKKLKNVAPLSLHLDKPRPRIQNHDGKNIQINIDADTTKKLETLCKQNEVTMFMMMLAAFKVLLYRYSGQDDICVGSPVANRPKKSLEDLIGFFVNTIALRSTITDEQRFDEFLSEVKQTTLEAYQHQDTPFEKIVERVVKIRDNSMNPLFQVAFSLQNSKGTFDSNPNASEGSAKYNISKFDLSVMAVTKSNGMSINFEYCTALFNESTICQMAGHFQQLIKSIAAQPTQKIIALNMMSDEERNTLLIDFNETDVDYSENRTFVERFKQKVQENPDKIALVGKNQSLTYRQLNEQSNQVAKYLNKQGIESGHLVAVCMNRSTEMIVSFLGIMKAGAAYVPIDPSYPSSRIQYIVEDTNAPLVIIAKAELEQFKNTAASTLLVFEDTWKTIVLETTTDLTNTPNPEQRAYVIYTSGSTGKPKGVIIQHKSLSNFLNWYSDAYKTSGAMRSTWYAGVGFDASVFELWPCLSSGGSLYIIEDEIRLDLEKLFAYHVDNKISHSCLPTALIPAFVEITRNKSTSLDFLMTGGDALTTLDIEGLDYQMINNYGPTENTVVATYYPVTLANKDQLPPIGKQASNVTTYVLDAVKNLAPIGIEGELYIGGLSLAEGYLNRPDLNLERFVPNPFSENGEDRLYRTGDIVRWAQDGNLQFIGRVDNQVQIRGYRVELGEIENILQKCPGVKQSAVIVKEDETLGKQLIAYVIPEETTIDKTMIKGFLNDELPGYMVPSSIELIDAFPLTSNGKLDKKALPNPAVIQKDCLPPQNETQEKIAAIWEGGLNVGKIGIQDNFFELGGHSIIAASMLFSMNKAFKSQLTLMDFFSNPTIEQLSKLLRSNHSSRTTVALIEEPEPHLPNLFFVPPILGSPIVFKPLAMELQGNLNSYGIQYNGLNDTETTVDGIEQKAEKFVQSIFDIQTSGEFIICGYSMGATIAYAMAKKMEQLGHEVRLILLDRKTKETELITEEEIKHQIQFHLNLLKQLLPEDKLTPNDLENLGNQLNENIRMMINYEVSEILNCPILALEARGNKKASTMQDWAAFTNNEFKHEWLQGGHYDILNSEYLSHIKNLILAPMPVT